MQSSDNIADLGYFSHLFQYGNWNLGVSFLHYKVKMCHISSSLLLLLCSSTPKTQLSTGRIQLETPGSINNQLLLPHSLVFLTGDLPLTWSHHRMELEYLTTPGSTDNRDTRTHISGQRHKSVCQKANMDFTPITCIHSIHDFSLFCSSLQIENLLT